MVCIISFYPSGNKGYKGFYSGKRVVVPDWSEAGVRFHCDQLFNKFASLAMESGHRVLFFGFLPMSNKGGKLSSGEPNFAPTNVRKLVDNIHNECLRISKNFEQRNVFFCQVADVPGYRYQESSFDNGTGCVNSGYLGIVNGLMATVAKRFVYNSLSSPVPSPSEPVLVSESQPEHQNEPKSDVPLNASEFPVELIPLPEPQNESDS